MSKGKCIKWLFERDDEEFYDYLDAIRSHLRESNSEYAKLYKEMYAILDKYPNLQKIVDEVELKSGLSTAECTALSSFLRLYYTFRDIEDEHLLFNGSMNMYKYLEDNEMLQLSFLQKS